MRRKDREMSEEFGWEVFDRAPYAVLGMVTEGGEPYCIPVSPARIGEKIYFHCAMQGFKTDCMEKKNKITLTAVSEAEAAKDKFTVYFESVVINGKAVTITDNQEKIEALRKICERYTPENMPAFDRAIEKSLSVTKVIRVDVDSVTAKKKRKIG